MKLFKLCDDSSYCWYFKVYEVKEDRLKGDLPLTTTVVHAAVECLLCDELHHLYVDNLYSTVDTAEALLKKGIYMTGTVRAKRTSLHPEVKKAHSRRKR